MKVTNFNINAPAEEPCICFLPATPNFPVAVKIDWQKDSAKCFGNYIDITRIAYPWIKL